MPLTFIHNLCLLRSHEIKRNEIERSNKKFQLESSCSKKRTNDSKSVFNRLSSPTSRYTDTEARPRLTSRVIRELPSRQEIVAAQGADSESRARNRRMFGSLLGTLHKFCQEESRLKKKEEKKAQIEQKVEKQEMLEREYLKTERETLFVDRKRKQMEIRRLELKMSRLKDFESWESSIKCLKPYIKTKATPSIYYRPKVLTKKTEILLAESLQAINDIINQKKEALNHDLLQLDENFKIDDDDSVKQDNLQETKFNYADEIVDAKTYFPVSIHNALCSSVSVIKDKKSNHITCNIGFCQEKINLK